jgi:hypothetical protein
VPSNGSGPVVRAGGAMADLGWIIFIIALFALARALVRLCERLM